jgi:hypothetical protein
MKRTAGAGRQYYVECCMLLVAHHFRAPQVAQGSRPAALVVGCKRVQLLQQCRALLAASHGRLPVHYCCRTSCCKASLSANAPGICCTWLHTFL